MLTWSALSKFSSPTPARHPPDLIHWLFNSKFAPRGQSVVSEALVWSNPQTWLIHHRQGRHSSLYKDVQGFDDGSVRVDEGDVVVGPNSKGIQVLLHEGRLWHIRHLNRKINTNALEPKQTFLMFTCPHLDEKLTYNKLKFVFSTNLPGCLN